MWATVPPSMHTLPRISHCPAGGAFSGNVELKVGASRPEIPADNILPAGVLQGKTTVEKRQVRADAMRRSSITGPRKLPSPASKHP